MVKSNISAINKLVLEEEYSTALTHGCQIYSSKQIFEELKKREPYVDYETEVLPNLNKRQAYIFMHYMINNNGFTQKDISLKLGYSGTDGTISNIIDGIFKKIDRIIELKKEREKFIKSFGGANKLEDLALCLEPNERDVLNNIILSLHPSALTIERTTSGNYSTKQSVINKLNKIVERKKECEKFIKNNGGEDFLINEFAPILDEEEFFVLSQFMMDYHYISKGNASNEYAGFRNYILLKEKLIKAKLKEYMNRKKEVDELIEQAGGAQKVLNELYLPLDDCHKTIFEERILAYKQTTRSELSNKLKIPVSTISVREQKLKVMLESMANENTASEKNI